MIIHLATDHAGFALKEVMKAYLEGELGYQIHDWGAVNYEAEDDFPPLIAQAAQAVAASTEDKAIIFGGSGQGEAMVANRFRNVRATVYYGAVTPLAADESGAELSIVAASRLHNDANVLSIGARYVDEMSAKVVLKEWLSIGFSGDERHERRIGLIDDVTP